MMRIQKFAQMATLAAAASSAGGAAAASGNQAVQGLPTFEAVYAATWNGMTLGKITLSLHRTSEFCYRYTSSTKPLRVIRMFYGTPSEVSDFCLMDGQVKPVRYAFDHGKDSFTLDFDAIEKEVRGAGQTRELPDNAQDRFGMHQAARAWVMSQAPNAPTGDFEFTMVEDDRMREYTLRVNGRDAIKVPAGDYDAFLLERMDENRIGRFWVAPGADYMPVKVETGKDGSVQLTLELQSYEQRPNEYERADKADGEDG